MYGTCGECKGLIKYWSGSGWGHVPYPKADHVAAPVALEIQNLIPVLDEMEQTIEHLSEMLQNIMKGITEK